MIDLFMYLAFLAFALFLVLGPRGKYAAASGWTFLVIGFLTGIPEYLEEENLLYPALAIFAVPFLAITLRTLFQNNQTAFQLSRAAAVAFLIFMPFALIASLRDVLISAVAGQALWLLNVLDHPAVFRTWNIIVTNGYATEIILACTGITAMAIMLGAAAGSARITPRQVVLCVLLIVPTIYVLNLLRIVFVCIAWSEQWFAFLPDPVGTTAFGPGYASFFWAHNVIMEALAFVVLAVIALTLFRIIPGLGEFARDLVSLYVREAGAFARWLTSAIGPGGAA
jgi:Predicted membrane protein